MRDERALADLATFARIEAEAGDIEPWAALLAALPLDRDRLAWLVKGYNAYDDLGSAWALVTRWPTPRQWATASDRLDAADYPCTQERRNLRGGKVVTHLDSYVAALDGRTGTAWAARGLNGDPEANWTLLLGRMRAIWGVGRQTAFEWAEFAGKVLGLPVEAPDADLWTSSGPRRSLERIYGPAPSLAWLDERAAETRQFLADSGVPLSWVDFETVICDFNVMRDGRYYPGRHLAALAAEIATAPAADRPMLRAAFESITPWADIAPGIVKERLAVYRDTGTIRSTP